MLPGVREASDEFTFGNSNRPSARDHYRLTNIESGSREHEIYISVLKDQKAKRIKNYEI
jgi:hypothetical protein